MKRMALWAALLLAAQGAAAEVREEHAQRPYTVQPQPGETLAQALTAATPIVVDGKRFRGYTRWNVRWTYRWHREASGRCRITEVTTRLSTEVQLPQLHGASAQQQAAFDRYVQALSHHEQGHVQIGRDAARTIDGAIASLPEAADCATLEQDANALGHRLLREHTELEKDYDRTTRYGVTQGVRLE